MFLTFLSFLLTGEGFECRYKTRCTLAKLLFLYRDALLPAQIKIHSGKATVDWCGMSSAWSFIHHPHSYQNGINSKGSCVHIHLARSVGQSRWFCLRGVMEQPLTNANAQQK